MAPTSNGELADAWGLASGKQAYRYLSSTLDEYYRRDSNRRIVPTEAGERVAREARS